MSKSDKIKLEAQIEYTNLLEAILEKAFGEEGFKKLMEDIATEAGKLPQNPENTEKPKKFKERAKK
jgi:hypothetical protein